MAPGNKEEKRRMAPVNKNRRNNDNIQSVIPPHIRQVNIYFYKHKSNTSFLEVTDVLWAHLSITSIPKRHSGVLGVLVSGYNCKLTNAARWPVNITPSLPEHKTVNTCWTRL